MKRTAVILIGLVALLVAWPKSGQAHHQPNEHLSINLSLSGGGTRAAAFAHGVLLELDEIRLCWKTNMERHDPELIVYYTRIVSEDTASNCQNSETRTLLEHLKTISGVSGGAITAAYYKASKGNEWKRSFREALLAKDMELELLTRIQSNSALLPAPLFRPALAITSIVDVVKYLATLPFELTGLTAGFRNPDFTPALFLASGRGLIKPDEMSELYRDWLFPGTQKNLKFGTLSNDKPSRLLINATDIKNGSIFTFDENTFTCMGLTRDDFLAFPITRALAASSALPVIFSPHNLSDLLEKARPGQVKGENCSILLTDHTRAPLLLDGGIVENLGLAKLLQEAFWRKNYKWNPHHDAAEQTLLISVNAAVQGGSSLPTLGKGSTIPQDLDQSFDVLMTSKTDVTRTIFDSALSPFGFRFIELRFPDISRARTTLPETDLITERIALQRLGVPFGTTLSRSELTRRAEESALFRQEREKVFQDLNSIGMAPTKEQIDLLISAGRAVVADRFDEIKEQLRGLTQQKYQELCGEILNITKNYCWPDELTDKDLLRSPLRVVLSRFDRVKEQHIKRSTANRTRAIEILQKDIRERLEGEFKADWGLESPFAGLVVRNWFCNILERDREYFTLYKDMAQVAILDRLGQQCSEIDKVWFDIGIRPIPHEVHKRIFVDRLQQILNPTPSPGHIDKYSAFLLGAAKLALLDDKDGITLLYQALNEYPNDININEVLGRYMIWKQSDYVRGLNLILKALKSSRDQYQKLLADTSKVDRQKIGAYGSTSLYQEQLNRFRLSEQHLKRIFVQFYLASPTGTRIELQEAIPDQEVIEWLKTHYPNGNGGTVVEQIEPSATDAQIIHRHCLLLNIRSNINLKGLQDVDNCKRAYHDLTKGENRLSSEKKNDYQKKIDESMQDIGKYAKDQLAESNGMKLALQYAEEGYLVGKNHQETEHTESELLNPTFYHKSEAPRDWGLALLIASGNAPCPERHLAVKKARILIREAETFLIEKDKEMKKGQSQNATADTVLPDTASLSNQNRASGSNTIPDQHPDYSRRLKNLTGYLQAPDYFDCVGNGDS